MSNKETRKKLIQAVATHGFPEIVLQDRPNTAVKLAITVDGQEFIGLGFSKVCWPDQWSDVQGLVLATRKAAAHIVHQMADELGYPHYFLNALGIKDEPTN